MCYPEWQWINQMSNRPCIWTKSDFSQIDNRIVWIAKVEITGTNAELMNQPVKFPVEMSLS